MKHAHLGYRCNACNRPVSLRHSVSIPLRSGDPIEISVGFGQIVRPAEPFDFEHLPSEVARDFDEALKSYAAGCPNAFAAMCRRTLQSAATELGAEGSSKVQNQLIDLKSMGVIDEDAFTQLKQIIVDGHDGAHPHLPKLNKERAKVLLELMKDVLYQLFVRRAKIQEAAELRKQAIASRKTAI